MVIKVIDKNNVPAFKFECYSPISINDYRIMTGETAGQLMQTPPRQINIIGGLGNIQPQQYAGKLLSMLGLNTRLVAGLEEGF